MALTFAACADEESSTTEETTLAETTVEETAAEETAVEETSIEETTVEETTAEETTPVITLQEVYDAGKNLSALLGDHESVHILVEANGNVIQEEYLTNEYCYNYMSEEYMDIGFEYKDYITERAEYIYFEDMCAVNVTLTPSGIVDMKEIFATLGDGTWISSAVLDDETASIIEKDGSIIVTCTADIDEILIIGEGVVSCVETYTLDAATREMTSVKTVYTYEDGTVEEGIATITRDVEAPEGVKVFLEYEQETDDVRMITIVSNPGTENEKTEIVRIPKGLYISIAPDFNVEETIGLYADAACTQTFAEDVDANADITVYVKWGE